MSSATEAAIIGGIAGGAAGGIFTVVGVLLGLFGERLVRRAGEVRCTVDNWYPQQTGPRPGGGATSLERRLQVTFLNRKEIPITVWEMRVDFYREGGAPRRMGAPERAVRGRKRWPQSCPGAGEPSPAYTYLADDKRDSWT